jgi:DNA-binding NarL/FixJ family response regulator
MYVHNESCIGESNSAPVSGGVISGSADTPRKGGARSVTALIDRRTFVRDCLSSSINAADVEGYCVAFGTVALWRNSPVSERTSVMILWANPLASTPELDQQLLELRQVSQDVPVIVMSDQMSFATLNDLVAKGVQAILPTTLSLEIILRAIQLVRAGGSFIPMECLSSAPIDEVASQPEEPVDLFSPRQLTVIKAMRKGLPNKVIAYQLGMCESTVKVHVRSIMKKLKAKNRTEVAFITQKLFPREQ